MCIIEWFSSTSCLHIMKPTTIESAMSRNPIVACVGICLILLGALATAIMFLSEAWPTSLFYILIALGIVLLSVSFFVKPLKVRWQLLIVGAPLILGYYLFRTTLPSDDMFLIPSGYIGEVRVYYDQPFGKEEEYEDGWRVYRIGENGFLDTQFERQGESVALVGAKYIFVDSSGNRSEIKQYWSEDTDRDTISIQILHTQNSLGNDKRGLYRRFYIGKPTDVIEPLY